MQDPEVPSQENDSPAESPEPRKAGVWADITIILIHLTALLYLLWVLIYTIPEYRQVLEDFEMEVTVGVLWILDLSDFIQNMGLLLVPLAIIVYLGLDIFLLKVSEGKFWRPIWLYGLPFFLMLITAGIQIAFQSVIHFNAPF
ncbi:MAG: hypothetical protein R3C11_08380 [Planctomycetaceae bacterium]